MATAGVGYLSTPAREWFHLAADPAALANVEIDFVAFPKLHFGKPVVSEAQSLQRQNDRRSLNLFFYHWICIEILHLFLFV